MVKLVSQSISNVIQYEFTDVYGSYMAVISMNLRHVYGSYKYEFIGLVVILILWYLRCFTETFEMMNADLIFFRIHQCEGILVFLEILKMIFY